LFIYITLPNIMIITKSSYS